MNHAVTSPAHVPVRSVVNASAPNGALMLSMSVAFGTIAVVVAHVSNVAAIDVHEFELVVFLAMLAGVPTTYVAAHARGTGAAAKPLAVTLLSGMGLGALAQVYTALHLEPWEKLWFFDIALGQNRGA